MRALSSPVSRFHSKGTSGRTVDDLCGYPNRTAGSYAYWRMKLRERGRGCSRPTGFIVFSALGRAALKGSSRLEAHNLNREAGGVGIGAQAWGLSKKLREVDEAITPERQRLVHEVHPEVSFWALNGSKPVTYGKKSAEGARERVEALIRGGFPREFVQQLPPGLKVGRDDFLDACVAAWTATRIATGTAGRMPVSVERDARGLDMAIWY